MVMAIGGSIEESWEAFFCGCGLMMNSFGLALNAENWRCLENSSTRFTISKIT
jgi:hypothetical protein